MNSIMTASMTAFARCQTSTPWGQLTWEMKSVNHRYLDISTRLPDQLRTLEGTLRESVSKVLARGKLDASLRFQIDRNNPASMTINNELLGRLTNLARDIEISMHESTSLSVSDVLSWPGIITEEGIDYDDLAASARDLLEQTLVEMVASRNSEGARLKKIILDKLSAIGAQVEAVRVIVPSIVPDYRQRLSDRLGDLQGDLDPGRLEQELVIFANKADITEELDRLESHISEVSQSLESDKPVGRRLDFLMQELNREANTMGSKAVDIRITNAAVELKVLIEQIREQVQNIE
jgi:uncharacterized protein (TIGR00255 family)